ncbi:hypothetical protein CgunFtcFv8_027045 [Champsocephalus gunnari]|uniref:Uncharacterized protein n=1 Tax=Champsocephalus gunnari TaxID=52237 RepID=A0AAN8DYP6_CHAGU|nr:hypothetical protein CgunFtcFv8_027045 [Champsocephalus gunnari]
MTCRLKLGVIVLASLRR